jgi:cytochrome b6-f complex iron-sulfur subunit
MTPPEKSTRRDLLDLVIRACGVLTGIGLVAPALAYLWPATRSGPKKQREDVGDAANWKVWEGRKVSFDNQPVLVVRTDKGFVALSAVCTHLGCLVEFDAAHRDILCPCHAGRFDLTGKVTGGPPPRPLPPFQVAEVNGKVFVSA